MHVLSARMHRIATALACLLAVAGVTAAAPEAPAPTEKPSAPKDAKAGETPAPPPPVVRFKDDKLSVKASGVAVGVVLDAIAKAVPLEVRGKVPAGRDVTLDIQDVPTQQAVERILGNQNFTLRYTDKGLEGIDLKSDKEEARPVVQEPDPNPPSASIYAPDGWWKMTALFAGKRVPIGGRLAQRLGGNTAGWDVIIQSFVMDATKDRVAAVKAGLKAFEADKELRDAVLAATAGMSDQQIAIFVRAFCRELGVPYLRMIARYTHDAELRLRVSNVVQQMRQMDAAGEPLPLGKMPPRGQRH